ncbi:MAG: hypothetical protein LBD64_05025 [Odoribacteraceae bacterium]|jgi:hypothetical protein|nr:hypothetical protein [Odoribacteraceae bacterium]
MAKKKIIDAPPVRQYNITNKAFYKKRRDTARKVLRAYGFDPSLLDEFSKQQLFILLHFIVDPPRFRIEKGHRVPRKLLDFISAITHNFMRNHYFRDPSIGLTFFELATHGLAFAAGLRNAHMQHGFPARQQEIVDMLVKCIENDLVLNDLLDVKSCIRDVLSMVSKVNFRVYGFHWDFRQIPTTSWGYITSFVYVTSSPAETIYFTHKQKERVAFRVQLGPVDHMPLRKGTIERSVVTREKEDPPVLLDVYIQSHALRRAGERMDVFPAHVRNFYITESLAHSQRPCETGQMLECYIYDDTPILTGYLPFIIQEEKLIVLSFLPFFAPGTPEGELVHEELGLQPGDMKFLGMDKLSFFLTVDLEQVPALNNVINRTRIPDMIRFARERARDEFLIDPNRTRMVKRFFEQRAEFEITGMP